MAILKLIVEGQTLKVKSEIDKIVENSINYLDYELILNDAHWNEKGLAKEVIVTYDGNSYSCIDGVIPNSIIHPPGFLISVVGTKNIENEQEEQIIDRRITTFPVLISVSPSGKIDNLSNKEEIPEESDYATQLLSLIQNNSSDIAKLRKVELQINSTNNRKYLKFSSLTQGGIE